MLRICFACWGLLLLALVSQTQNHKPFRPKILKTLSPPTRRPEEANPKPFSPKAPNNYPKPRKPEAPKPPKTLTP